MLAVAFLPPHSTAAPGRRVSGVSMPYLDFGVRTSRKGELTDVGVGVWHGHRSGDRVSRPELEAFLRELALLDRSPATVRSYRQGVEHFLRWLSVRGVDLEAVSTRVVGDYVESFKAGAKEGAVPVSEHGSVVVDERTGKPSPSPRRRPRTVNHRLSVLSSFFADRTGWRGRRAGTLAGADEPGPPGSPRRGPPGALGRQGHSGARPAGAVSDAGRERDPEDVVGGAR